MLTEPFAPSEEDKLKARAAMEALARHHEQLSLCAENETIEVPRMVLELVKSVLAVMAEGQAVSIVPCTMKLTTQQAAEFLNVSRPFIVDLLDQHQLAFEQIGSHRRIQLKDLLAFRREHEKKHGASMQSLVDQSQELGLEDLGFDSE